MHDPPEGHPGQLAYTFVSDSYPIDVSHLCFNFLCLLLLYVSNSIGQSQTERRMRGLTDISRRTNISNREKPGKGSVVIDGQCHGMVIIGMISVANPHQIDQDPDPDPASLVNADPDSHPIYVSANTPRLISEHPWLQGEPPKLPAFHFDAIRIRVRLFTLTLIRVRILFYADPNPAFICGSESGFLKGCGSATLLRLPFLVSPYLQTKNLCLSKVVHKLRPQESLTTANFSKQGNYRILIIGTIWLTNFHIFHYMHYCRIV